jgi:hypothetical protein
MASLQCIDFIGLDTAKDFWTEVVLPDYKQFTDAGNTRDGVHAALTAWHLHDWLFLEKYPAGGTKKEKKAFQQELIDACPELRWLREFAETAKHRALRLPGLQVERVEPATLVERTTPIPTDFGSFSLRVTGKSPVVIVLLDDGSAHQLFDVLARVIEYWRTNWIPA